MCFFRALSRCASAPLRPCHVLVSKSQSLSTPTSREPEFWYAPRRIAPAVSGFSWEFMFSPFITWAANGMLKKAAPTSAPKAATPPLPVFLLLLATRGLSTVISHSRFCRLALALAAALVLALLHVASLSKPIAPPSLPFFAHSNSLEDSPMSLAKQRAVSAVVGGFVADAATMGLHWIYDQEKLQTLVATTPDAPEFHEPPACPFYQYNSGAFSPYGDEVFPLLKDVATRGTFDAAAFATVSYEAAKSYTGRLNSVFRELVKKGDAGETYPNLASESKDLHGGIKVPVLVAKYLDDTATLVAKTKEATRVHQIGVEAEEASVASALLLQQLVLGVPIKDAVAALTENELVGSSTRTLVQEVLDAVRDKTYANSVAAIEAFGKACPLPGSLKGALFVLLTSSGYADAVRANMLAGGDNCSRSILIGACAAAAAASDPIPPQWKQKTTHFDEVRALAEKLVA